MGIMTRFGKDLLALFLLTLLLTPAWADEQPTLTAITDSGFVPFEMMNLKTGKMEGFDLDILAAVAKRAGFNYQLKTLDFKGIIPALQTQGADLALAGITITQKRSKVVDFSIPYYQSGLRLLVRSGNNHIENANDLSGKHVGTKIGSTSYKYLHDHLADKVSIKPFPSTADMYMSLMGGSVDAVLYDAPNVAYFAATKGKGRVKVVGPLFEAQPYGIAFAKGSKWVKPVNQALDAMQADGSYADIYKRWFGKQPPK